VLAAAFAGLLFRDSKNGSSPLVSAANGLAMPKPPRVVARDEAAEGQLAAAATAPLKIEEIGDVGLENPCQLRGALLGRKVMAVLDTGQGRDRHLESIREFSSGELKLLTPQTDPV
jgi:hypothetical protein